MKYSQIFHFFTYLAIFFYVIFIFYPNYISPNQFIAVDFLVLILLIYLIIKNKKNQKLLILLIICLIWLFSLYFIPFIFNPKLLHKPGKKALNDCQHWIWSSYDGFTIAVLLFIIV
jgi:hypothetical protein